MDEENFFRRKQEIFQAWSELPSYHIWKDKSKEIISCLLNEGIPLVLNEYVSDLYKMFGGNIDGGKLISPDFLNECECGILLEKRRVKSLDCDKATTKWAEEFGKTLGKEILYSCVWHLYPVGISFVRNASNSLSPVYKYWLLNFEMNSKTKATMRSLASIETKSDGSIYRKKYLLAPENLSNNLAFPKDIVRKINQCLIDNFLFDLWDGNLYAAWYRTNTGAFYYLGRNRRLENKETYSVKNLIKYVNGPNGDAALILLAFTCFSVLKPFFHSYPSLNQNSKYLYVKKNIPKQIAVNIRGECARDVQQMVNTCCGYFQSFPLKRKQIVDGIIVEDFSVNSAFLGVGEFESKVIQPACQLWVNRSPSIELIRSGRVLDIQLHPQEKKEEPADTSNNRLSEVLVNSLVREIENETTHMSQNPNWINKINERIKISYLRIDNTEEQKTKNKRFSFDLEYEMNVARLNSYSRKLRRKYISVGEDLSFSNTEEVQTKIEPDLDEGIVRKIAYLMTAFGEFLEMAIESFSTRQELYNRTKEALISAFMSQMQYLRPNDVKDTLEDYILNALKSGHCARIRGYGSNEARIHLWYNPRKKFFLLPLNECYENIRCIYPSLDISKGDFLNKLVQANILHTVQRSNQLRRSFEIVVERGTGRKVSVLEIKLAALSKRFAEKSHEFLDELEKDDTSYRS